MINFYNNTSDSQSGDTIIEVILATAIGALAIVLALALMNRSFAQIQLGVETTFVRQSIDGEAETIRYLRDSYVKDPDADGAAQKAWKNIEMAADAGGKPSVFGTCIPGGGSFYIDRKGTDNSDATKDGVGIKNLSVVNGSGTASKTFARIGEGIWVEAVKGGGGAGGSPPFIDFHILACWEPPFSGTDKATLGTIVRQYYE